MSVINITDIPKSSKYEGYIWMSNESKPRILTGMNIPDKLIGNCNPFIIEAELWDKDNMTSYAIHHAGNQTICQAYKVKESDFNDKDIVLQSYASHRMGGFGLRFLEYWVPTDDPQCLNMPTLELTKRVFIGFTQKEN